MDTNSLITEYLEYLEHSCGFAIGQRGSEGSSLLLTLINFEQGSSVDLTPFYLPFYLGNGAP